MPINLQPHQFRQIGSLEFLAKQAVEGFITGLHRSPYHGFSVEFAEHRLYNPGESMRHVDWKLYARSDRFYVKTLRGRDQPALPDCDRHLGLDVLPRRRLSGDGDEQDQVCHPRGGHLD